MSAAGGPHPSFLELERHALGAARAETAAHLASCEICRGRLPPVEANAEAPAWALRLAPRRAAPFAWPFAPRLRTLGWGAAAFACAVALWFAGGHLRAPATVGGGDPYVGTKGGPELWLYVKRQERVEVWNGTDPIHPGDLLRLKVQPDRYRHISVFGRGRSPDAYVRLYDAALGSEPTVLPFAWKVDAQPGDETLLVVLGPDAVAPDAIPAVLSPRDGGRHWTRRLVLAKAVPRDGARP